MKRLVIVFMAVLLAAIVGEAAAQQFPPGRPSFFGDIMGGVNIPTGPSLGASFDGKFNSTAISGPWTNTGSQGVSGRIGLNVGFWASDDPAKFLSHIGGAINFSYNTLNLQGMRGSFTQTASNVLVIEDEVPQTIVFTTFTKGGFELSSSGHLYSLAFLFNARQGFLPDDQVPYGRLQIYGGLGPAMIINNQKFTISSSFYRTFPAQTKVSPGLMMQAGARYFFTRNVYACVSFDYRYFQSSFNVSAAGFSTKVKYDNNLLGVNFGAGLQF
jgi:opacity protein-like surface antigen